MFFKPLKFFIWFSFFTSTSDSYTLFDFLDFVHPTAALVSKAGEGFAYVMLCHHSQGLIARENKTIGCAKRFREHRPLLQNPELYYVVCRKPSEGNLESESVTRKLEEILSFHQPFFCS